MFNICALGASVVNGFLVGRGRKSVSPLDVKRVQV